MCVIKKECKVNRVKPCKQELMFSPNLPKESVDAHLRNIGSHQCSIAWNEPILGNRFFVSTVADILKQRVISFA